MRRRHVTSWLYGCAGLALGSCVGSPPPPPSGDDASTSAATESSTGVGATSTSTTVSTTTDPDSGSSTSSGSVTSTTSDGSSSSSSDSGCMMTGELGSACTDVCDCMSGDCFVVGPLGGVCSECDESADCKPDPGFGCNFGNPLIGMPAVCSTTGDVGESCETAEDCAMGLYCPTLIEVSGILSTATCSGCEGDMGCMMGQICAPTYDIANIGGYYSCVAPGSVPNDSGCNLTGDGSECESGQCAPASLMGIPVVAVCSPCNEDGDCGGGLTCQLPEIAVEGSSLALVPGMCV